MEMGALDGSIENVRGYTIENIRTWAEETGKTDRPRVLLTSVFGPFARDDEFGSRKINPMELYHNQVTRAQGSLSFRKFHDSWGIRMIQANISAPSAVLDFPTKAIFEKELGDHRYEIVGISSIIVNVGKVKEMCRIVRRVSPHSKIIVGGHVAAIAELDKIIDADHIVRGEGIRWMRRYLGEDENAPIVSPPYMRAGHNLRFMGIPFPNYLTMSGAVIISSVGCPMGCNFCSTSAFFGGKGKTIDFYKTGEELFRVMCDAESAGKMREFSILDENFLLNRKRAMELLKFMKENGKAWALNLFSSANAIRQYSMEELVELGVGSIWIGLESPNSKYPKLEGSDTKKIVKELQEHGIKVLGSTIIGLEHHTPKSIKDEIEYAVSHGADLHQFMLYTPIPGTQLYKDMEGQNRLLGDVDVADMHGQYKFNFQHRSISRDESKVLLDWAFRRDFEYNGPSVYRMIRTTLKGWKRYKNHPDQRIRQRIRLEELPLRTVFCASLWAMERMYKNKDSMLSDRMRELRIEIEKEFGLSSRIFSMFGPIFLWAAKREEERLKQGVTYEPPTTIERKNWM